MQQALHLQTQGQDGDLLTRGLARWLTAPIGLACPHQPRLPPSASLAPMARRRFGTGTRHWAPALAVGIEFSFSLFHI